VFKFVLLQILVMFTGSDGAIFLISLSVVLKDVQPDALTTRLQRPLLCGASTCCLISALVKCTTAHVMGVRMARNQPIDHQLLQTAGGITHSKRQSSKKDAASTVSCINCMFCTRQEPEVSAGLAGGFSCRA
jgi:hypothetical protein